MKKRINKNQLMELNKNQRRKLLEIWEPEKHDVCLLSFANEVVISKINKDSENYDCAISTTELPYMEFDKNIFLPLLDIGQMIDIKTRRSNRINELQSKLYEKSFAEIDEYHTIANIYRYNSDNSNLCDVLWSITKDALEYWDEG